MRLTALFLIGILSCGCMAQTADDSPLLFDALEHDFGKINETDGVVEHTFTIANISKEPVRIDHVATSCGCTTAQYSTDPIAPGKMLEFTVAFNPARTEGKVYREIEVFTDGRRSCYRITLIADVNPAPVEISQLYPVELAGGVRTSVKRIPFGYMAQGKNSSKSIVLINTTDKDVKISALAEGKHLSLECPEKIQPGVAESIIIKYDIPKGVYGTIYDTVWVSIDGVRSAVPLVANAICTDDFSQQKENPLLTLTPSYADLGTKPAGKALKQQFTLGNEGDAPLKVRAVECAGGTVTDIKAGTEIMPGSSVKFTVSFKSAKEKGASSVGSVNLITNDPTRPRREVRATVKTK